jgi:hypothetical protein
MKARCKGCRKNTTSVDVRAFAVQQKTKIRLISAIADARDALGIPLGSDRKFASSLDRLI